MINNYSLENRERKARRKGLEAGYKVSKGFQHYHNGGIVTNWNGERFTGYDVSYFPHQNKPLPLVTRGFDS